jgi:MFS family permease
MATDKAKNTTDSDPATAQAPGPQKVGAQAVEPKAHPTEPLPEPSEPAGLPPEEPPKRGFTRAYWMCNTIEMFERLAYFGIRSVVPLYIMQATEPGGLHLSAVDKGIIYMWWAIFQSWLPMFTGGIADRYGYKRVLSFAITANAIGYLMMAFMHSHAGFFAGILLLATGTAFFKPALQGSIAQNLTKDNSSVGWGVFYWVVNVGAVLAPVLATIILGKPHSAEGWRNLFIASSLYTCVNLFLLLTFKDVPSGADKSVGLLAVFVRTVENIWPFWCRGGKMHPLRGPVGMVMTVAGIGIFVAFQKSSSTWSGIGGGMLFMGALLATWLRGGTFRWQLRLPAFLLIMSCFWMMMYQLWDLHPNFITDWVDSSAAASSLKSSLDIWWEYGDRGLLQVPQQILLNLNAFLIVLLVIPVSWAASRMRTLSAMLVGMSVATIGILVAGLTGNGWILLLGIVFFSLGEMWTGPKKNEYLGLIAPPGKKGLYLGYVNIPIGVGVGIGSWFAGVLYDNYGEKATLALNHLAANPTLVAQAAQAADWSDSLEIIPDIMEIDRDGAFEQACREAGADSQTTADMLRRNFQCDRGQIINMGLQYLALHPDMREETLAGLARLLSSRATAMAEDAEALQKTIDASFGQSNAESAPEAAASVEGTDDILRRGEEIQSLTALLDKMLEGVTALEELQLAQYVHLLPDVLELNRAEVLELVRQRMDAGRGEEEFLTEQEVNAALWRRFGDDPNNLDNLALEYLAQATELFPTAIERSGLQSPADDLSGRKEEIETRFGIGRTKAFLALGVALGADDSAVRKALREFDPGSGDSEDAVYAYLMSQPHHRFLAIARKDWTRDVDLLVAIVESDPKVREAMEEGLQERSGGEQWRAFIKSEDIEALPPVERMSERQDLVQKALSAKDWSRSPNLAARVLELNLYEARKLVAAEVNHSAQKATSLLWDAYKPQYRVWIPFAAIGVGATIALGIFGQMAKRWKDMNA